MLKDVVGLPEPVAAMVADIDRSIARGDLVTDNGELARLIGHPTTPLTASIQAALA